MLIPYKPLRQAPEGNGGASATLRPHAPAGRAGRGTRARTHHVHRPRIRSSIPPRGAARARARTARVDTDKITEYRYRIQSIHDVDVRRRIDNSVHLHSLSIQAQKSPCMFVCRLYVVRKVHFRPGTESRCRVLYVLYVLHVLHVLYERVEPGTETTSLCTSTRTPR
eukprot:COSAG02_NODE_7150_length_3155_cov_1125.431610_2_plen_167_part_00